MACRGGARIRNGRHQRRYRVDRSRAVRRRQGKRPRQRRIALRPRRLSRDQVPVLRRHRLIAGRAEKEMAAKGGHFWLIGFERLIESA
ncbi:conserved hypothetical protein [Burkholderia vietnamiensis]|nr:conserved hypothetical protein [Burkholderia vietnamiensis]CAG9210739.1 conserved hypothetical protein [Burkholderia vietnamiensis]